MQIEWLPATAGFNLEAASRLEEGWVHLWRLRVPGAESPPLLSPDERVRAERFVLPRHRQAFAARRTWLRVLLGRYLACDPLDTEFAYGPNSKPEIADGGPKGPPLRFSSSSAGDWLLIALTSTADLGVDIEAVDVARDFESLAHEAFSVHERAVFDGLSEAEKPTLFTRAWTQKEAYLKATGNGLTYPLRDVEVSLRTNDDGGLDRIAGETAPAAGWTLRVFEPAAGYQAAVAVAKREVRFLGFDAPDRVSAWLP